MAAAAVREQEAPQEAENDKATQDRQEGAAGFGGGGASTSLSMTNRPRWKNGRLRSQRHGSKRHRRLVGDVVMAAVGFVKSLRTVDLLLLGAIVVLLLVVVGVLFPVTLTWGLAIIKIHKWPFWIWTRYLCCGVGRFPGAPQPV